MAPETRIQPCRTSMRDTLPDTAPLSDMSGFAALVESQTRRFDFDGRDGMWSAYTRGAPHEFG